MNKALKVTLLSAFIFPGIGHFSLKKPLRGTLLAGIATACLYLLISRTVALALQIVDKIQHGEVQPDVLSISELVARQSSASNDQMLTIAAVVFLVCWLFGIVDSYRIAHSETAR